MVFPCGGPRPGVRGKVGINSLLCGPTPVSTVSVKKIKRNRSLVTVHAFCYRSRMEAPKCKLCETRHYGLCAAAVVPSEPRARRSKRPAPGPPAKNLTATEILARRELPLKKSDKAKVSENDSDICPTCGRNLAARDKERARRRAWMRKRRKNDD